jgi:predicted DCC family thiol-disulfide oxidoreductase YuxK
MVIVYFDGLCNVCNAFVDFLIRRDSARVLRFAPLQGSTARARLPAEKVSELSTMAFQDGSAVYYKSSAAIRAIASLGGVWQLMRVFLIVPPFLRNFVYRWVANHRYLFAGRRDTCRMPTAMEREQFLD